MVLGVTPLFQAHVRLVNRACTLKGWKGMLKVGTSVSWELISRNNLIFSVLPSRLTTLQSAASPSFYWEYEEAGSAGREGFR